MADDRTLVTELGTAGYITRQRNGRRNQYTINTRLPLPDPLARNQNIGELLEILTGPTALKRGTRPPRKHDMISR